MFRPWRHIIRNKPLPHRGILDVIQNSHAGIESAMELIVKEDFRHKREDMMKRVLAYMSIEESIIEKCCKGCDKKFE